MANSFPTGFTWGQKPKRSPKLAPNALFDLPARAHRRRRGGGSKHGLGQGLSRRQRRGPARFAWIRPGRERAESLPSSRKDRTHCSTAAVCSRRASGMLRGANSTFMAPPARGQPAAAWNLAAPQRPREMRGRIRAPRRVPAERSGEEEVAAALERTGVGLYLGWEGAPGPGLGVANHARPGPGAAGAPGAHWLARGSAGRARTVGHRGGPEGSAGRPPEPGSVAAAPGSHRDQLLAVQLIDHRALRFSIRP